MHITTSIALTEIKSIYSIFTIWVIKSGQILLETSFRSHHTGFRKITSFFECLNSLVHTIISIRFHELNKLLFCFLNDSISNYALPAIIAPLIRSEVRLHFFANSKPPLAIFAARCSLEGDRWFDSSGCFSQPTLDVWLMIIDWSKTQIRVNLYMIFDFCRSVLQYFMK